MFLAEQNINFICIDKKRKPEQARVSCGYSWNDFIEKYGFSKKVWFQHYDHFFIHLPKTRTEIKLPENIKKQTGYLNRSQLYSEMYNRAKDKGLFLFDHKIEKINYSSTGIKSIVGNDFKIEAKIFVDCSGREALISKKVLNDPKSDYVLGIEYIFQCWNPYQERVLEMFIDSAFSGGYGWPAPVGDTGLYKNCGKLIFYFSLD